MIPGAGIVFGVGGGLFLLARAVENYHLRRFREHAKTVKRLHEQGDVDEIHREVGRFAENQKVDWALELTLPLYGIGITLMGLGVWMFLG